MGASSVITVPVFLAASVLMSLWPIASWASGGISQGIGSNQPPVRQRPVDERYEYGKALYLGRLPESPKIDYCVLVDDEPKKVKRRWLKPYRGETQLALANALVRCEDPSQLALQGLERGQIAFVLYYLNKRYRLKLASS